MARVLPASFKRPKTVIRIVSVVGPWQLLLSVLCLKLVASAEGGSHKDYLVIHGAGMNQSVIDLIMKLAGEIWQWERVLWLPDFVTVADLPLGQREFGRINCEIVSSIGVEFADEVYLCKYDDIYEKLLVEAFSSASLLFYEDGIGTWLASRNLSLGEWVRAVCSLQTFSFLKKKGLLGEPLPYKRIKQGSISKEHMRRVRKVFLTPLRITTPTLFKGVETVYLEKGRVISLLREVSLGENMNIQKIDFPRNSALVLGQCYFVFGLMDREDEVSLYVNLIKLLEGRGYKVFWKDHPRANPPLSNDLRKVFKNIVCIEEWQAGSIPVEVLLAESRPSCCVSINSASLFYCSEFLGIPGYSAAEECIGKINSRGMRKVVRAVARIFESNFPSYKNVPEVVATATENT